MNSYGEAAMVYKNGDEAQDKLYENLFTNYSRYMAPYNVHPSATENPQGITISLWFLKIVDVEETIEQVDLVIVYLMNWADYRLTWSPADYNGIDSIFVYPKRIWMPDITIWSNNGFRDDRNEGQRIVKIFYNGSASAMVSASTDIVCSIDVRNMPFDTQNCKLTMGSYSINARVKVDIPMSLTIENLYTSSSGEWTLSNVTVVNNPRNSYASMYTFSLKRHATFYVTLITLPYFLICILTIFGVFKESQDPTSQLHLMVANVTALAFILNILSESLPKTEHVPYLAQNVYIDLSLTSVAYLTAMVRRPIIRYIIKRWIQPTEEKNKKA
ncbi:hypothetical protein WR25_01753 [Diploscapter pachys]|uniref:Neurotransmitter-gated ion-channel ligand-binding domain-containing protein n=1 Tax=Diploscapter pachys TaxID=2018661 RepID=A0A2A2JIH9_9BILA|nr:hypothetical protein WR25_01753 [Diploscapter pachys]